jgi:hypothetical protein
MRRSRTIRFFISLACALAVSAAALSAQDEPAFKPFDFGVSAGVLLPGSIYIGIADHSVVNSVSPVFKAHFDAYLIKKLSMGLYASLAKVSLDHWENSTLIIPKAYNGVTAYEIGCSIKPCFWLSDNVVLKPALELGYRRMSLDMITDDEAGVNGMALGGGFALKFKSGAVSPFASAGIISQPVGGNDYTSVSFAPIITMAGGVEF